MNRNLPGTLVGAFVGNWQKIRNQGSFAFLGLLLYCTLIPLSGAVALAQEAWSPQEQVPDYYDLGRRPSLVADRNRTVHAFNSQPVDIDGFEGIFYRQWTREQGWTTPVDILLTEDVGQRIVQGVYLDPAARFHLIFFGQSPQGYVIRYATAFAANAGDARAWSEPTVVGIDAGPQPWAALIGDGNEGLIVLYSGQWDGIGLYEVHSTDSGSTWSEPRTVFRIYDPGHWPIAINLARDGEGRIHAVWSVVNTEGFGEAIYYARREAEPEEWSDPILLAVRDEGDYSANWPTIAVHRDELFVIYQDSFPATRWMRRSADGGQSWTAPKRPFPHQGEYVSAVLLEDSSATLHMVLGNRTTGDPQIHGMWHSVWLGESWRALAPIASGPKTVYFDPSDPEAVISQGNVLLAIWWTDTVGEYRTGPWYSSGILEAPELPITALPTLPATATPLMTAAEVAVPVESPPTATTRPSVSALGEEVSGTLEISNSAVMLLAGLTSSILVIAVVLSHLHRRTGGS